MVFSALHTYLCDHHHNLIYFFLFFHMFIYIICFWVIINMKHFISFRCTTWNVMICCFYAFPKNNQYNKTALVCHHTILLTIFPLCTFFTLELLYSWPLNGLHLFHPCPHNPCFLAMTDLFFVSMSASVLCCLFRFHI